MKPIISGSGTGKNTYINKFFTNNVYDKIIACAYYGTNFDYSNMVYMLYATNNPILICDKIRNITLSYSEHKIGELGLPEPLDRSDAISLITTSENNYFSIEDSALIPATLSSYKFFNDSESQFHLIKTVDDLPVLFGTREVLLNDGQEATIISTPIWSVPEFFCNKFNSELPCCVYFEGVCPICNKIVTRKIIERPRFSLNADESKFLDRFCQIMKAPRDLTANDAHRIPIISKNKWSEGGFDKQLDYETYVKGARLYNKALRSIGGDAYEYDPTRVNVEYTTLVYFDKSGSHRLNFNPYKRVLDSNSLIFVDSLTCLLWTDSGNQARSKGGVPTDLLTTIQTTTFSNVRPLYVPNPSFDPFGGSSFNEMIGGSFVSTYEHNGFIGNNTNIGDRRDGRRVLRIDSWLIGNPYDDDKQSLTVAVDNENKTIIVKLYDGSYVNNKVIDLFVSTKEALYDIFINEVIYEEDFNVGSVQTYDEVSFPKSYKKLQLIKNKKLFEFLDVNAASDSLIHQFAVSKLEDVYGE